MPVQQHVLNWLYSVLTSEYHDVNRTYNDIAQTLTRYPSLSPRTDVHTFQNGSSALLLHISGTLPVSFRGSTYRFPLSVWVPHAYPREAPLLYVTPTDTMIVRPGQYVDPQGQVYHPHLAGWAQTPDRSNLQDFLAVLADVFSKEPPVVARQRAMPPQLSQSPQISPSTRSPAAVQSPPPLPRQLSESGRPLANHSQGSSSPRPPPPPPKTHAAISPQQSTPDARDASRPLLPNSANVTGQHRYDTAPPLPYEAQIQTVPSQASGQTQPRPQPPLPPHPQYQQQPYPLQPTSLHHPLQNPPQQGGRPQSGFLSGVQSPIGGPLGVHGQWQPPQSHIQGRYEVSQLQMAPQQQPILMQAAHQVQVPPPPPDLMDEPLTLSIPTQAVTAPPIPPNPEKDALLRQLAQTLYTMRSHSKQQNEGSLAGLDAQRNALLNAMPAIQAEMGQLIQLSNALNSNQNILHEASRRADGVIEGSKSHPPPDIDELLVAPTVVGNQLYNLVAEERALGDAIFMLGRAVERGRISTAVFSKMTRSLAREWYLKKALVHKIGQGMGLQ